MDVDLEPNIPCSYPSMDAQEGYCTWFLCVVVVVCMCVFVCVCGVCVCGVCVCVCVTSLHDDKSNMETDSMRYGKLS